MNCDFIATIFFIVFATTMAVQSTQYGLGRLGDPGPGFLPFFSSVCIGLLSFGELLSGIRKVKRQNKLEFKLGPSWQKAIYLMGVSFLYTSTLLNRLGYVVSTTLWLISILWIGDIRSWKTILLITGLVIIISYFLFEKMANLPLPKGVFGF
jgi:hypothetical protein